ncbi:hypothetical protein AVEN_156179-1 [Araneus ventricosus]|uniref:Uncharacterized protein n=1 Tax=Araneus ventricosus TaxID=182803 RepID=A0A4Y2PAV9_ARAVE|nr:hypothetical protein AVEN_156179-1 [Araneus ventricosus]
MEPTTVAEPCINFGVLGSLFGSRRNLISEILSLRKFFPPQPISEAIHNCALKPEKRPRAHAQGCLQTVELLLDCYRVLFNRWGDHVVSFVLGPA